MANSTAAVVVPAIIACLVICAIVLFTCKFCYNPRFLLRNRRSDVESSYGSASTDKPPSGEVIDYSIVSVSSSGDSSASSSMPEAIPVREVTPDRVHDATVIAVAPNSPPVIEALPRN
ncbi:hypothetical protein BDZ91DRAFT_429847 [Kalaharituber pfeilii]|nr:hypothetical protein BDZ91DRAFT_429847 [Kalaharituber pfeilii]